MQRTKKHFRSKIGSFWCFFHVFYVDIPSVPHERPPVEPVSGVGLVGHPVKDGGQVQEDAKVAIAQTELLALVLERPVVGGREKLK